MNATAATLLVIGEGRRNDALTEELILDGFQLRRAEDTGVVKTRSRQMTRTSSSSVPPKTRPRASASCAHCERTSSARTSTPTSVCFG